MSLNPRRILWLLAALLPAAIPAMAQPVITTAPVSQTVVVGGQATFSVAVSGTGPFSYQWQCNGTNLPNCIISTVAGNGSFLFSGDGGQATNAGMAPYAVALDNSGNIYFSDAFTNVIRKINTNGIITTVAGNGTTNFYAGAIAATNTGLNYPFGLAVDANGNLFVADEGNSRIRNVTTNGIIMNVAGDGFENYFVDGGAATNSSLLNPWGVAVDASGNLFIANGINIRKVNTNGIMTTVAGGAYGFLGDGGPATNAWLDAAIDVSVDTIGNLFIVDEYNFRIRKVNTNGVITTIAGIGNDLSGYGFSGDGGPATSAALSFPYRAAADPNGNVFIADTSNNRIRKVATNGIITTVAGNGSTTFSGDGGAATNTALNFPEGLAVDINGNIFIADSGNARIRKVDYSGAQPALKLNAVNTNNTGNYAVIVTDGVGNSVTSSVVRLTVAPLGYNQVVPQRLSGGQMRFAFTGLPGTNYVLERTFKLAPANWLPQITNPADGFGAVVFTNSPIATTNNFWRIRSWP